MKLENQVVSLALAQKLKELGVKQESLFKWTAEDTDKFSSRLVTPYLVYKQDKNFSYHFSAFTVAELGEMLPLLTEFDGFTVSWESTKLSGGWKTFLQNGNYKIVGEEFRADTEADARAKMLVYLLENKLISL